MKHFNNFASGLLLFIFTALLSACTSNMVRHQPSTNWVEQQQRNQAITLWRARGKLNITELHSQASQSVRLYWRQEHAQYKIQLSGPIGFGRVILSGDDKSIEIKDNTSSATFESIEQALKHYHLPPLALTHLHSWMLGLVSPQTNAQHLTVKDGLLQTLEQGGWSIHYKAYTYSGATILPSKISLTNTQFAIEVDIYQWEL